MATKMVFAILDDSQSSTVMRSLHDAGYPLTLIDSTGGLLKRGKSTLIAGVEEKEVDTLLKLIQQEFSPSANPFNKRATIMVFSVDHFEQIA